MAWYVCVIFRFNKIVYWYLLITIWDSFETKFVIKFICSSYLKWNIQLILSLQKTTIIGHRIKSQHFSMCASNCPIHICAFNFNSFILRFAHAVILIQKLSLFSVSIVIIFSKKKPLSLALCWQFFSPFLKSTECKFWMSLKWWSGTMSVYFKNKS